MKIPPHPSAGMVLSYSFLWSAERARGQIEGTKDRPVAIVLARRDLGDYEVAYAAPVTHTPPPRNLDFSDRIAIPQPVKERLGLDDLSSWISTTELNAFVWPGHDLRPVTNSRAEDQSCLYGYLPRGLFIEIQSRFRENFGRGIVNIVKR